jgi:hypothetical protein
MKTGKKRGFLNKINPIASSNRPEFRGENPFTGGESTEYPGPGRVELEFPGSRGEPLETERYLEILQEGAKRFPWFHELEFEPSDDIRFALSEKTIPAIRRVLIAFMGGGTRREAAARVPMSRSAFYKTIRREIYFGGDTRDWIDLGLLRGFDLPVIEVDMDIESMFPYWCPEDVPQICTLCHRVAGFIPMEFRNYDFTIINDFGENPNRLWYQEEVIRGHLIAHFGLWARPRANDSFEGLLGYRESVSENRRAARRWDLVLDPVAITAAYKNQNKVLPVVDGRQPTEMQLRRFYRNLIKGT